MLMPISSVRLSLPLYELRYVVSHTWQEMIRTRSSRYPEVQQDQYSLVGNA